MYHNCFLCLQIKTSLIQMNVAWVGCVIALLRKINVIGNQEMEIDVGEYKCQNSSGNLCHIDKHSRPVPYNLIKCPHHCA